MKLRIIAAVVLLAVIAAALGGAWLLQQQLTQSQARYEDQTRQLQELSEQAQKLQADLDGLNLDLVQERQSQADDLTRQARDLEEQMQSLRTEMEELNAFLEENQEAAAQIQEEMEFLQGVYDALEEGLKKVEGYIAGN